MGRNIPRGIWWNASDCMYGVLYRTITRLHLALASLNLAGNVSHSKGPRFYCRGTTEYVRVRVASHAAWSALFLDYVDQRIVVLSLWWMVKPWHTVLYMVQHTLYTLTSTFATLAPEMICMDGEMLRRIITINWFSSCVVIEYAMRRWQSSCFCVNIMLYRD